MRRFACLGLVTLMLIVLFVPMVSAQNGPEIDVLRYEVILGSPAQVWAMEACEIDVLTQMKRTADIIQLASNGFTITEDLGFHVCFIGFNVRPDQAYRRPEIDFWPLADVDFRHALAHSLDREGILPLLYGWIVTPVHSLVPPAQSKYFNPAVPEHPFNLGNPFLAIPGEHSTCGILLGAGYNFVDADASGDVTYPDYWTMPNGDPLPEMEVLMPRGEVDFNKHVVVLEWLEDCISVGLGGTWQNGYSGLTQGNQGMGYELWDYASSVYRDADFDLFIINFKLNRFPDHLYDWLHSSQDSLLFPWAYNAFGVNDPTLDGLLDTVKFSLDQDDIEVAAEEVQVWLADPNNLQGLPVLPVYSMSYYNAFKPDLRGIVKSLGYGSGDGGCVALREPDGPHPSIWTYTNIRWEPVGTPDVDWCLSDYPERLNPSYAGTAAAWEIMDRVYDPLITVSPYNHQDKPWLAEDWEVTTTATGMDVTYYLRDDVFWQDGYQYTALDAEFSLEFITDYQIPKYRPAWQSIIDVEVINPTTFTVHSDETSLFLIYDWSVLAALFPQQIWARGWLNQEEVLDYDPTIWVYGTDMAPDYVPGPWADQVLTNLFGTGPFIFQFYDQVNEYSDLWANENYFLTTQEIRDLKTEMFWEVGDYNRDGIINVIDITYVCLAYGTHEGEPGYDPDADFNQDGWVNIRDLSNCAYHLLWQKEYP